MRTALRYLSASSLAAKLATKSKMVRQTASRFIAGETLADAITITQELNRMGVSVQLDYLGQSVTNEAHAKAAADVYLEMLDSIRTGGMDSHISPKPSQMGQGLCDNLCSENLWRIVDRSSQYGNFVWIDMEAATYTDATLRIYKELISRYKGVGVALQANLYRTSHDLDELVSIGGTIRLCKGGYQESRQVSFRNRKDVDHNFTLLADKLLSSGTYQAIGTHDEKMIQHVVQFANTHGIAKDAFEFQMGYGMRLDLQKQILGDGYRLRLYVVYGSYWYPYFMRRLAERPANILLLLQSLGAGG